MNILLDQGAPKPINRYLPSHIVQTAFEMGWSTPCNGVLLNQAEISQSFLYVFTAFHVFHLCRFFGTRGFRRRSLFANTNMFYFGRCAFFCSTFKSLCQTKLFLSRFHAKKFLLRLVAALRGLHAHKSAVFSP